MSFSPCVYPLIPVTLAFIGVKSGPQHLRGLFLSLVYVLGLAVTYSILGLVASLTGKLFGQLSRHPVSFLIIGNACLIAGLSFFDVFNINFMGLRLQNKVKTNTGYLSAFLLGLTSGLAVSPCVAPALGAILVIVASKQNIVYGASLLFTFAYGMGFSLILIGTFGGLFLNLTKSGIWLARIKKTCGFLLVAMGEYFILKAGMLML